MPKAGVRIYDENNNVVKEVPYGENGITGATINGERQQVYQDTDKNGNTIFVAPDSFSDPYIGAVKQIDRAVSLQAPQVSVKDGRMTLSGSQSALKTPLAQQMREQLQSLKGTDITSKEVQNALNALNEEVKTSIHDQMVKDALGWTPEQYKDYQYTVQTVRTPNPMSSSNKVKGQTRDGKIEMKTPQEWIDYYREAYSTDERTDAFKESLEADSPYARTMALIMSGGEENPVYGFDPMEKIGQLIWQTGMQLKKGPYGLARRIISSNNATRVDDFANKLDIPVNALWRDEDMPYNEIAFEDMKKSIEGKNWGQLSDIQKAFIVELGVSKENPDEQPMYRGMLGDGRYRAKDLENMSSENEDVSKEAISHILVNNSYDDFAKLRDEYNNLKDYDYQQIGKEEERLSKNAIWSQTEQAIGNFAGTIGRTILESLAFEGATGVGLNKISDVLGDKIVNGLSKIGVTPTTSLGKGIIRFTANLAGTVPEDIVQTAFDNVVTYNDYENENLFDPDQMSDNFKMNLIFMTIFNAAGAGISTVKRAKIVKKIAETADLDQKLNVEGMASDADDIARAVNNGGRIETDSDGKVYKVDRDGNRVEMKNTTPEQAEMVKKAVEGESGGVDESGARINTPEFDDAARAANDASSTVDGTETVKTADGDSTVKVEVDTVNGSKTVETADYVFKDVDDITSPKVKIKSDKASIKNWHTKAQNFIMRTAANNLFKSFRNRFGDITAQEFDWVYHNIKDLGKRVEEIIGTKDPVSGKVITQNTIDALRWWSENPLVKKLRMASLKALGRDADMDTLGYLPHTNYDPSTQTYEEATAGQLWNKYTGKSMHKDGQYIGYGGTLEGRYQTFVSNMLWDMRNKEIAASKLLDEAELDGNTSVTPEQATKAADGGKKMQESVNKSDSVKKTNKLLESNSDYDQKAYDEAMAGTKKDAEKLGLGKAYHDNYKDIYIGADGSDVQSQPTSIGKTFSSQSDTMRNIVTKTGSMYDYGGADLVYAPQNAVFLVNRYMREGGDLREMFIDFIQSHSHRSKQYAEAVADRWMEKLNEGPGELTKGKAISNLSKSMRSEAMSRLRKWLVTAKYDQFNRQTRDFIDDFLFRHMQMDSIKNNPTIAKMLKGALNGLTSFRYKALFYGNFKNALLQISELNRLFTSFKWGDVGSMLKKLATDADFRDRVDMYVDAVSPETSYLNAELYGKYKKASDVAEVGEDGVTFGKIKDGKKAIDDIALAPINAAESLKNRTMIAALVAEADNKGLSGDDALRYIRRRFERVALAANEMGRIGLSSNPLAKPMLFLQNFQIRELGMHYYNIKDLTGAASSTPKAVLEATKYLTKVFGSKLATTLILARLGYSASQTLGLDPFGLASNYTGLSDEEMNDLDRQISGGVLTPFFAGGMTSLFSDMYFMARKAYEDSVRETVSDDAEKKLEDSSFWDDLRFWEQTSMPKSIESGDFFKDLASDFAPGNVFFNRIGQMNDMLDSGWATSATGNKMYTAPTDPLNVMLGYLFGRSATQNALQYSQTYGDDLGQTLSRTIGKTLADMFGGGYQQFDPIDKKNYSDWFKGGDNDAQQFEKGRRYFQSERDRILDEYQEAIGKSYASSDDIAEAKNNMNLRLGDLYDQLDRFVDAYENKNGTIDSAMAKKIVNILNTGMNVASDTPEEAEDRRNREYNKALERYTGLGMSPVGTYSGPTKQNPDKELKYQGSPQYRTMVNGIYNAASEAVAVLKQADATLKDIRKEIKDSISSAYDRKDYDELSRIQYAYLDQFDKVVSPIIAEYGYGILSNTDVTNQLKDMLSTGTKSRSGDLIPSEQYKKDKKGKYRSMPLETVDVKKWAQQRFNNDIYKNPTYSSNNFAENDIVDIKRLISDGKPDRARAKALQLKVRVDNQRRALSRDDYQWLLDFLNNIGE